MPRIKQEASDTSRVANQAEGMVYQNRIALKQMELIKKNTISPDAMR